MYRKNPDIDKTDSFWKWQEKPNQCSDQIVRWPQNSFETLQEFWSEFWWPALVSNHSNDFWVLGRIRWTQNSHKILQGFWSEFWLSAVESNNSDDFEILKNQMSGILMKFFQDMIRIRQEIDDHGIFMKFFKDLYQNSGGQP